jgi:glycosyltransferase involved in cell wall biosynthesis
MKICFLTLPSGWGGTELHTVEFARILAARGHEISVVELGTDFYGQGRIDQGGEIRIIHRDLPVPLRAAGLMESFRILRNLKGDVCIFPKGWFHDGSQNFDLAVRLKFSRYITIEHLASEPLPPKSSRRYFGNILPGIGVWWYKAKFSCFLRSLWPHRVVCVSDAIGKILIDHYGFPRRKITMIHNGIDSDKFQPNANYRAAFRKMWGIPQDALVFGSIGRLNPVKGFQLALKLFGELLFHDPRRNLWFVLVGDGPELDALRLLAEDPLIKEKVKLIGFTDRPWEIYPAFDVFLMPSRNEGLPLTLLEAMSCGCCPIAMSVGGVSEVIIDPSLGWLVQPNDQLGFSKAMKETAGLDPHRLREMGRKGRERVVLNFEAGRQFMALADLVEREGGEA